MRPPKAVCIYSTFKIAQACDKHKAAQLESVVCRRWGRHSQRPINRSCNAPRFPKSFGAALHLGRRREPSSRAIVVSLPIRLTRGINCDVDSNQSDTICRNSSKAFISSRRPVRALPASVFIRASAIGSIPSKSSKLVAEVRRRGSVITCVTGAGANC